MTVEVDGDVRVERLYRVLHVGVDELDLDGGAGTLDNVGLPQVERHLFHVFLRNEGRGRDDLLLYHRDVGAGSDGAAVHTVVHERILHEGAASKVFESAHGTHLTHPGSFDEEVIHQNIFLEVG